MHGTLCEQSDRPLLRLCATSALIVGMVGYAASTAHSFSIGPLPGLNCGFPKPPCDLASALPQYQEVHQLITSEALIEIRFTPPSGGSQVRFAPRSIRDIEDGNAETDRFQGSHELHFDNAWLFKSSDRLVTGNTFLLGKLRQTSTMSPGQAKSLRTAFGSYLHTVQDFYAHSNYTNLASRPPIQLGKLQVADPPSSPSPCLPGDTSTLSPEGLDDSLTSGHAGSLLDLLLANAPEGECAHGFLNNGIHKDWPGRTRHEDAYNLAKVASMQFVISIINDSSITNKDNVCMFMTDEPCQNSNSNSWNGTWIGAGTGGCDQPIPIVIAYRVSGASGESGSLSFAIIPPSDPAHNSIGSTFTLLYEGNIARPANPSILQTNTLNGDTMTESYPPSCWTATLTRQ